MISINLSHIAVLNIKGSNYRRIISGISKSEVINLIQNIKFNEKSGALKKINIKNIFKAKNVLQILIETKEIEIYK